MLNEADKAKAHPDILLELSQLLDKYIVEYYKKEEEK
ncbi:MAG: Spo0E family sporulation regulatory protein-aspartic acid phosphatase [Thermosyntropha sp.]|nr:Spo0E family sporulation regulatory protein-aspartic acid phosphatase [Thermosyntropha sp.]